MNCGNGKEYWRWLASAEDFAREFGGSVGTYLRMANDAKRVPISMCKVLPCRPGKGKRDKRFCMIVTAIRHKGIAMDDTVPCKNCPYREFVKGVVADAEGIAEMMRPVVGMIE